jgi:nicotinamidase-related amidase
MSSPEMRNVNGKLVFESLSEVLRPSHCALLVIDMQNDLLSPRGAYARGGNDDVLLVCATVPVVVGMVSAAREASVPVFFTQNTTLKNGSSDSPAWIYFKNYSRPALAGAYTVEGSWGHEIIDDLAPLEREVVVRKHRSDAFVGTDLDLLLRAAGVRTVVTAGIVTNGCVESTVRHAAFLDYYSVLVEDACASTSLPLHEAALTLLRARHDVVQSNVIKSIWGGSE